MRLLNPPLPVTPLPVQLTESQLDRYLHHLILKDIGGDGQQRLLASKVLIVGAGGLGSPAALYLAAAGVGRIGICDGDSVELSNLQRQILHSSGDVGRMKAESAAERMRAINPDVGIAVHAERLEPANARALIGGYDFIVDCTDNFDAKFLINDTCVELKKPCSHAGVVGFKGQAFTYEPGVACLSCIFPEPPPAGCVQDCRGQGIVGAVAGVVGSLQAAEAIKWILQKGERLSNRLFTIDALTMEMKVMAVSRGEGCAACGGREAAD